MLHELIQQVRAKWTAEGIPLPRGAGEQRLARFERGFGVRMPPDMRYFYSQTDGMGNRDESDSGWFRFWDVEELASVSKHFETVRAGLHLDRFRQLVCFRGLLALPRMLRHQSEERRRQVRRDRKGICCGKRPRQAERCEGMFGFQRLSFVVRCYRTVPFRNTVTADDDPGATLTVESGTDTGRADLRGPAGEDASGAVPTAPNRQLRNRGAGPTRTDGIRLSGIHSLLGTTWAEFSRMEKRCSLPRAWMVHGLRSGVAK